MGRLCARRAARSWRKPRNGARPVPGPIMMRGVVGSSGRRNADRAARRRPRTGREAYLLYVERPVEGGNEADGPFSPPGYPAVWPPSRKMVCPVM